MTARTRKGRPRRRVLATLGVGALVLVVAAALVLRSPSPVGHWNSAAGQDDFRRAYARAMADLPRPDRTLDVRTGYGIVRVYRFEGTSSRRTPLVLLPGTQSSAPVWADNLPSLLQVGDVYLLDLLGEPGMSVQERPITDDADKARWLHETLERLPEPRFHVVGLSIGGWTAVNLALREPAKIATVTTLDPVQVYGDIPPEAIVRTIPTVLPFAPRSWRDAFTSWTAGGAPVRHVPVADLIESGMRNYTMVQPTPSRIGEAQLRRLDVPVLAIVAGRSVMHDATAAGVARRALKHGTVRVYPDASHAINGEYPRGIARDLRTFLATHDPG